MRKYFVLFGIFWFLTCGYAQKTFIPATHKAINIIGRYDITSSDEIRYDWPNTTIRFRFTGTEVELAIKGGERNYFNLFINDSLHSIWHQPQDSVLNVKGLDPLEIHELRLQKRTEGEMGMVLFKGIYLPDGEELMIVKKESGRKIEFIGNSITCGYGVEGETRHEKFQPSTENVNKSYALIASRALNADSHVIAHSGLGVVRNYGDNSKVSLGRRTMPQRFNQTFDSESTLAWDFSLWKPDVVVVNLGTNDYSTKPHPEKPIFQSVYISLLDNIYDKYGNIPVFLICGPLIDEPAYTNIKEIVSKTIEDKPNANLYFIGIPKALLNSTTNLGSDSHPSYSGQLKIANHILPTIATVMHWNYVVEKQ